MRRGYTIGFLVIMRVGRRNGWLGGVCFSSFFRSFLFAIKDDDFLKDRLGNGLDFSGSGYRVLCLMSGAI